MSKRRPKRKSEQKHNQFKSNRKDRRRKVSTPDHVRSIAVEFFGGGYHCIGDNKDRRNEETVRQEDRLV